ncbi:MAG: Coupling protein TraD [Syntrophorhabdaceae bacterium PtaU1.Bin034]|nr:MAG: Coupling protein TraD [Syntrophorhabdaceae bacterium PtaU1.Bin034]
MKKDETYKGFETWFNAFQMTAKMHLHIFMILGALHVLCTIALSGFQLREVYVLLAKYMGGSLTSFAFPDPAILKKIIQFIVKKSLAYFVVCAILWFAYPWILGRFKQRARKQAERKYVSGARLVEPEDFRRLLQDRGDLPFGSFQLPRKEEIKHVFVIGRPGTGKTVFLSAILEQLRARHEKIVLYDFKGDYISRFFVPGKGDILFNPLDQRSTAWNVFAEIKTELDINTVAESLIPPVYTGDAFWNDAGRAVFAGILHYLWANNLRTNAHIWRAVTAPGQDIRDWIASVPGGQRGLRFVEDASSKQAMGVFAVLMQYVAAFEYLSRIQGDFTIDKWLAEPGGCIFVTNKSEVRDTLKPILSLFIDLLAKKLLSLPDDINRRVFFVIDEFGTLQRLSAIKDLLIASRSKGGSAWLGIQDMGQINKLYTQDVADTIVNASGTSVMFAVSDPKTARYLSDKIGDTEFIEPDQTVSFGVADNRDGISLMERRKIEKLLKPSDIMNLPDLNAYVKIPNVVPITRTVLQYKSHPSIAESFVIRPDLVLGAIAAKQVAMIDIETQEPERERRDAKEQGHDHDLDDLQQQEEILI